MEKCPEEKDCGSLAENFHKPFKRQSKDVEANVEVDITFQPLSKFRIQVQM